MPCKVNETLEQETRTRTEPTRKCCTVLEPSPLDLELLVLLVLLVLLTLLPPLLFTDFWDFWETDFLGATAGVLSVAPLPPATDAAAPIDPPIDSPIEGAIDVSSEAGAGAGAGGGS